MCGFFGDDHPLMRFGTLVAGSDEFLDITGDRSPACVVGTNSHEDTAHR